MTCCLTAPSHYLNQSWLIITYAQWDSSEGNFERDTSAINQSNEVENFFSKISFSLGGQWVKFQRSSFHTICRENRCWSWVHSFDKKCYFDPYLEIHCRDWHIPLPNGPGQVKLPVRQVEKLGKRNSLYMSSLLLERKTPNYVSNSRLGNRNLKLTCWCQYS